MEGRGGGTGLSEQEVMGKDSTSPCTHPPHPNSAQPLSTRIPNPGLMSWRFNSGLICTAWGPWATFLGGHCCDLHLAWTAHHIHTWVFFPSAETVLQGPSCCSEVQGLRDSSHISQAPLSRHHTVGSPPPSLQCGFLSDPGHPSLPPGKHLCRYLLPQGVSSPNLPFC